MTGIWWWAANRPGGSIRKGRAEPYQPNRKGAKETFGRTSSKRKERMEKSYEFSASRS